MKFRMTIHLKSCVIMLASVMTSLSIYSHASAADYNWVDKSTIKGPEGNFKSSNDPDIYELSKESICPDRIVFADITKDHSKAEYRERSLAPAGKGGVGEGNCTVDNKRSITIGGGNGINFGGSSGDGTNGSEEDICNADAFTWIICPAIEGVTKAINGVEGFLVSYLKIQPINPLDTSAPLYKIWDVFRNLANFLFIFAFVFIIFTTTTSYNINAYTIKKMLPKLVIASILVQFSYIISAILVDIGNVLGLGLSDLLSQALSGLQYSFSKDGDTFSTNVLLGMVTVATAISVMGALLTAALSGTVLLALITGLIALLTLFAVLAFRQVLIYTLVVLAPVAFVAWILPNTESLFKLWYKNLFRAIIMFPLIILLLAAGKVFSITASTIPGMLSPVIAIIALAAPLFFAVGTLKFAGAAMAVGAGALSKLGSKGSKMAQDRDGYQRLKARTEQRKRELAGGLGVNMMGRQIATGGAGTTLGQGALGVLGKKGLKGIGAITPGKLGDKIQVGAQKGLDKSNAQAMASLAKDRQVWGKRLEDEGFDLFGYEALVLGEKGVKKQAAVSRQQIAQYTTDLQAAEAAGDDVKAADLRRSITSTESHINNLEAALPVASRYSGNASARTAAMYQLGQMGNITDAHRQALNEDIAGNTPTGRLVANQAWSSVKTGATKTDPHLVFTNLDGTFDHGAYVGYVAGKNQNILSGYRKDSWDKLFIKGTDTSGQKVYYDAPELTSIVTKMGGTTELQKLVEGPGSRVDANSARVIKDVIARVDGTPPPTMMGPSGGGGGPVFPSGTGGSPTPLAPAPPSMPSPSSHTPPASPRTVASAPLGGSLQPARDHIVVYPDGRTEITTEAQALLAKDMGAHITKLKRPLT